MVADSARCCRTRFYAPKLAIHGPGSSACIGGSPSCCHAALLESICAAWASTAVNAALLCQAMNGASVPAAGATCVHTYTHTHTHGAHTACPSCEDLHKLHQMSHNSCYMNNSTCYVVISIVSMILILSSNYESNAQIEKCTKPRMTTCKNIYARLCVCLYIYIYICICVYKYMYVYVYV